MIPTLYSQPLLSLFCEVENLDAQGFQLTRPLLQHGDLMRDRDVGKVRIDGFYNPVSYTHLQFGKIGMQSSLQA